MDCPYPPQKISPCGEVPISRRSTLVPPPVTNFRFPHPHPLHFSNGSSANVSDDENEGQKALMMMMVTTEINLWWGRQK